MRCDQRDWLPAPIRAMSGLPARRQGTHAGPELSYIAGDDLVATGCAEVVFDRGAETAVAGVLHSEPPHRISRELLTRAVAYRIQEQVYRGLKPSTRRLLLRLANDARAGRPLIPKPSSAAPAGTVLMREWHGVTHEVRVLDRGVLYKRKRYRSLSEVAQLITGAHWNGPQFFGLRGKRQEAGHGSK